MAIIRIVYPHFVEDNMKDDMPARGKAIGQAYKIEVCRLMNTQDLYLIAVA